MHTALIRHHSAWIASAAIVIGLLSAGPIIQPDDYHAFADARSLGGIGNAADVLSNLGFLLIGLYGLTLPGRRDPAYATLCAALVATAFGSSWYHLMPDDARLVWDRLPIALACAAVLARVIGGWLLPLVIGAIGSVAWWVLSGDLRPYLLLQVLPLTVAPLIQWQRGAAPRERRLFGAAIALYAAAKLCELADHALFGALGVISGHTLKHLLASAAAWLLVAAWGHQASQKPHERSGFSETSALSTALHFAHHQYRSRGMHVEVVRFDRVFDAAPQRGDFSFTSQGRTTYGAILPSRLIPAEGSSLVMAFAKPGDWSTLLGYRDPHTGKTWLKHRSAWLAISFLELTFWVGAAAFAAGVTLFGTGAAVLMAGAAGALVIAGSQRRNWRMRKLLAAYA